LVTICRVNKNIFSRSELPYSSLLALSPLFFHQNGDLNWIVKDKILAFAGPSFERNVSPEGYCTLAPSDYIPYFQRKNVGLVVRLNKRCYNEQDFVNAGIKHVDAFFLDGSCPPTKVLYKVLGRGPASARTS
jgi:hypothetical protein